MSLKAELIPLIWILKKQKDPIRKISAMLKISKNTVKKVLREQMASLKDKEIPHLDAIRGLFAKCDGNAVRVHELLVEKHRIEIGYSTLTNLIREAHLRQPKKRVGQRQFGPGVEMQHDTSPHQILLGDKPVKAQCAAMILAYCREVYMQYFPQPRAIIGHWSQRKASNLARKSWRLKGTMTDSTFISKSSKADHRAGVCANSNVSLSSSELTR